MSEPEDERSKTEHDFQIPPWDAVRITRRRAQDSRTQRDAALDDLRISSSREQILAEFGIDIGQLEG